MKRGFITINSTILPVFLALTPEEQEVGLMNQPKPPIMAFPYKNPCYNRFWMKNTPAPLDIVFCYKNKISQIQYGEPYSLSMIGNDELSDLVIEFPYQTCQKLNFKIGESVTLCHKNGDPIFAKISM